MDSQEKSFERTNQKKRTRIELLRAARELVEAGGRPSVAEVADRAGISRATAYRYFSTPDEIIREAVLEGIANTIRVEPPPEGAGPAEAAARVDRLVTDVFQMITSNESLFRALLGASAVGDSTVRRGGRRLGWLRAALAPLEPALPRPAFERLVNALALLTGIEALVVLRDVCEVETQEGEAVLRWMASTLIAGALGQPPKGERP
ncbi:TetR/AcrR family transcriptional regulator [Pleomorphomonas sp. PLEO]|uniref:TetR/AcrR family transcriptional regulator n=1 Tax=Pleomorphomonas sp. PLEO TaxID=3239306 RepID=UPI00351E149C